MWGFLKSAFTDNLALKVLSLGLAVVIFLIVRADKAAVATGYVEVEYQYDESKSVLVSKPPKQLRISVRGPWSKVNRFDDRSLPPLKIKVEAGKKQVIAFQPDMIDLPRGIRVVAISPPSAEVHVERLVERKVPLRPRLVGLPAQGYVLKGGPLLTPDAVLLIGPEDALDRLAAAGLEIALVDVTNAEQAVEVTREVTTPLPEHARALTSLQVRVQQDIVALRGEKALAEVPVVPQGWKDPNLIPTLDIPVVGVWLEGPLPLLHKLEAKDLSLAVDLSKEAGKAGAGAARISLAVGPKDVKGLPKGITATKVMPPRILLTFARKEQVVAPPP